MQINGREIADKIYSDLKNEVLKLSEKGIIPHLCVILVGDDPASKVYVSQKQKHGQNINTIVDVVHYNQDVTQEELVEKIKSLNSNLQINGIIVQRPLPKHIDPNIVEHEIDIKKDIDGFKQDSIYDVPIVMATIKILEEIFKHQEVKTDFILWLKSKKIALIGKGSTAGKPLWDYFHKIGVKASLIDSKTKNPEYITQNSDIVISSVGKTNIITSTMIKKGAILISVGISKDAEGKLHGDYEAEDISPVAGYYTPTPGGIGPVNVAMLLQNLITSSKISSQ